MCYKILKPADLKIIPKRKAEANKGDFKKLLVIAGSYGMSGAAYLSAFAAYRTGSGLVRLFSAEDNRSIFQTMLPEAVVSSYREADFRDNYKELVNKLDAALAWAQIIVLGPGLGSREYVYTLVKQVLVNKQTPVIIDADALNCIAANPDLKKYLHSNAVITPHLKEMSRLSGESLSDIKAEPIKTACAYSAKYKTNVVLKQHNTITAACDGRLYKNLSGSPALAKAGSGDVLTGVIAGLFCIGFEIVQAAAFGVYLHGLAGEEAQKKYGEHGVLARDVIECIPYVMQHNQY